MDMDFVDPALLIAKTALANAITFLAWHYGDTQKTSSGVFALICEHAKSEQPTAVEERPRFTA